MKTIFFKGKQILSQPDNVEIIGCFRLEKFRNFF